jgi:DNA-binding CsgD family transcriptional regulator
MGTGRKYNAARDVLARQTAAETGVILMDLSFRPIAIDRGATSILSALSHERFPDTANPDPTEAASRDIQELMRHAEPDGPESMKLRFHVGAFAYTGHTYLIEQSGSREKLMVFHLKRDLLESDRLAQVASRYHLTDREQEALRGIAMGLTNKELAQRMNIAPNTVKTFLRLVMVKMGVARRTGVVAKLLEHI